MSSSNGDTPFKHSIQIAHDKFVVDGFDLSPWVSGFSILVDPSDHTQLLSVQMAPDFEFDGQLDHITLYMQCHEDHGQGE